MDVDEFGNGEFWVEAEIPVTDNYDFTIGDLPQKAWKYSLLRIRNDEGEDELIVLPSWG